LEEDKKYRLKELFAHEIMVFSAIVYVQVEKMTMGIGLFPLSTGAYIHLFSMGYFQKDKDSRLNQC